MRFLLIAALMWFATSTASANERGNCTRWEKRTGYSCVFNGRTAPQWVRQCSHQFDNTIACMQEDPNTLAGACTQWYQSQDGVRSCYNGIKWERRWVRGCTKALLNEEFCSDTINPNSLRHERLQPVNENDSTRNPNYRPVRKPCGPNRIC